MSPIAPIAIDNVRIFDGNLLTEPQRVVIDDGHISNANDAPTSIDGAGATLLPGLIDTHVHLHGIDALEELTAASRPHSTWAHGRRPWSTPSVTNQA